jgi:hypothetical protein
MRQCSLDQGGGYLFTVSSLGASPGGLNYYSLMLPSVLLTAMADVTIDFVTDVTYDTVKRLKRATSYPFYRRTNIQQHSRYYRQDNVYLPLWYLRIPPITFRLEACSGHVPTGDRYNPLRGQVEDMSILFI